MALVYGQGRSMSVMMAGPFASGGGAASKMTQILLPAASWKGGESPYYQAVSVDGISVNSFVELMPSVEQVGQLLRTALTAVNEDGVVTVYAYGDKPLEDMTIQAALTEVVAG